MSLTDILLIAAAAYFGGIALLLSLALSLLVAWEKLRPEEGLDGDPVAAASPQA